MDIFQSLRKLDGCIDENDLNITSSLEGQMQSHETITATTKGNGNSLGYFEHPVQDAICQGYLLFQR
jgi:hypothetical protein